MPEPFSVRVELCGTVPIVVARGDVAYDEAPTLRAALKQALLAAPARLVVDLSAVDYMNTPGLATLIESLQTCRRIGAKLVLVGLGDRVRAVFEIARLLAVFPVAGSTDEALTL